MAVTIDDVRRMAELARVSIDHDRAAALVAELNGILVHMDVLQQVNTKQLQPVTGVGAEGLPLRADHGPPIPLARAIDAFGPLVRDGFFLVPRLATHEHLDSE